MFPNASSISHYLNLSPQWAVLTTIKADLADNPSCDEPQVSQKAMAQLAAMRSVVDLTHTVASNAKKSLIYFTAFNVLCYHFTGWISGVALMYGITIVAFGWISHNFAILEAGSLRLKEIFVLISPSIREPTHLTWEEIQALQGRERDQALRVYHTGAPVLRKDQEPSLCIRDGKTKVSKTLEHVQYAIREVEHLRNSLPLLNYFPLPFRTPLKNLSINLTHVETHLKAQPQG